MARRSDTPIREANSATDSEFDRSVWMRLAALVPDYARRSVERLPRDVQAYFVTRLFEWETKNGGTDAFLRAAPELIDLVAPAYRHLGLISVAESFTRFEAAEPTQRLLADPSRPLSDPEVATLRRLFREIGTHDVERIAFVRANPDVFSF